MKFYTVHLNDAETRETRQIVFVKEGMAWPALAVPLLWLLYHRLWFEAAGYFGLSLLLTAGLVYLGYGETPIMIASFALQLLVAAEGNELRRLALARKGARFAAIVHGGSEEEAEERFFRDYDGALPAPRPAPAWGLPLKGGVWPAAHERAAAKAQAQDALRSPQGREQRGGNDVLGIFPEPSGWRT